MQQVQQEKRMLQHTLTRKEACLSIIFPLCMASLWGFLLLSGTNRWSMALMNGVLFAMYLAQTLGAVRNTWRVWRGETVLVATKPMTPIIFVWAFAAIFTTAFSVIALVAALLTLGAITRGAPWFLSPLCLVAGILLGLAARGAFRRLRQTQYGAISTAAATVAETTIAPKPERSERWWTRNDTRP
jgi:hypothetical protein